MELRDESDPGRVVKLSPLGALIDPAVWDRIAARRAANRGDRHGSRRNNGPHLFDGFVYCGKCGSKCYAQRNNNNYQRPTWRYVCSGARTNFHHRPGFAPPCQTANSMADTKILDALGSFGTDGTVVTARPSRRADTDAKEVGSRLRKQIEQATTEQTNAQRLAIAGKVTDALLDEVLRETGERIAAAQAKLDDLTAASAAQVDEEYLSTNLDAMRELTTLLADDAIPVEDRRAALRHAGVEAIYIDRPSVAVEVALSARATGTRSNAAS